MRELSHNAAGPRIVWPRGMAGFRALLLADQLTCLDYHWVGEGNRTVLCSGDECRLCDHGYLRRWKAYCACLSSPSRPNVAELTWSAVRGVVASMTDQPRFRGAEVHLRRCSEARTARVEGFFVRRHTSDILQPTFDILPILASLFGRRPRVELHDAAELCELLFSVDWESRADAKGGQL